MSEAGISTTRASLEDARVALGHMMSTTSHVGARAPLVTMAVRANDALSASERVLHDVTGRSDVSGQLLVAETRKLDRITLEEAHALVALHDWVERTRAPGSAAQMLTLPPTDAERTVASNALAALVHAAGGATLNASPAASDATAIAPHAVNDAAELDANVAPTAAAVDSPWAPSSVNGAPAAAAGTTRPQGWSPPIVSMDSVEFNPNARQERQSKVVTTDEKKSRSSTVILLLCAVIVIGGGVGSAFYTRSKSTPADDGVAAYTRGSRGEASLLFVKAAQENPRDARALTYLGRMAREDGNLSQARTYLDSAVRVEPNNALALREFASALLADNQPELARRFYVRALGVNADDHISQGFLGCALVKLQRADEAQRWFERAGTGDWSRCATPAQH